MEKVSRMERKWMILCYLAYSEMVEGRPRQWHGTYEIAVGIGLKPTNYVREILSELLKESALEYDKTDYYGGTHKDWWRLSNTAFDKEPFAKWFEQWKEELQNGHA